MRSMIGLPYGDEPGQFNCWTFTQKLQRDAFGRMLPDIDLDNASISYLVHLVRGHDAHKQWVGVERPVHGGIVEMSCSKHPHHIGTYAEIDGGGIIHCDASSGGTFAGLAALKMLGWRRFIFYDWKG
jgi:hypothetical protein